MAILYISYDNISENHDKNYTGLGHEPMKLTVMR